MSNHEDLGKPSTLKLHGSLIVDPYLNVWGPAAGVPPQPANFSAFLNGEPVRNQDLVNWVTVGAFDVPTSESAPITSVAGRRLAFWLLPYNYFDEVRPASSLSQPLLAWEPRDGGHV